MLPIISFAEKRTASESRKPRVFLSMVNMSLSWDIASRSVGSDMYKRTHMEILRVFVDPLEGLCYLLLVFFTLQNFLPRRPL